jgi:integrase
MRLKLTPASLKKLAPPATGRVLYWDDALPGFGVMVTTSGHRSFVVQYRTGRRSYRLTLKPGLTLTDARGEAKAIQGRVAKGGNPLEERRKAECAEGETLKAIVDDYFRRDGNKLRSVDYRRAAFDRLILPALGRRQIGDIKRKDIGRVLDKIEDEKGPAMAQLALAYLSRVMNWHASRDDDFRSPIVRGMGRIKPDERARDRVLSDDELRAFWRATDSVCNASGPAAKHAPVYGHCARFILLTATRRNEAAQTVWTEFASGNAGNGREGAEWIIPASRMKGGLEHVVPLSPAAASILDALPRIGTRGFVFTIDGANSLNSFSKFKRTIDAMMVAELRKMAEARGEDSARVTLAPWVWHDLRRTARSLMSRAGVTPDIAERCLAHKIGGVRGTYDRYAYYKEKGHAFAALAALVDRILNPPAATVVPLRKEIATEATARKAG